MALKTSPSLRVPEIDPARLIADLRKLATFGAHKTGVHRPSLSPADMEARRWFCRKLEEAGLESTIDGIGSVFGLSGRRPAILTGSHLESQNHAGWLDGALGMVYGLEAARIFGAAGAPFGVDVAAFFDEEGHFGSFLGSRSFVGLLTDADIDAARNRQSGTPLRGALQSNGLGGRDRLVAERGRYRGFLEAHIEQGETLESGALKIGIVTAIVAIWQYRIMAIGAQNHAGTTGMARRRDAGAAIVKLMARIYERFPELAGPRSVWTNGRITLDPGAASIIPGSAEAVFQFRDTDPVVLERLHAELERLVAEADAAGPCQVSLEVMAQSRPAAMDETIQAAIEAAAAARCPGKAIRMPSGAGHDAQYLARMMPSGMVFVPSIGGISHHWTENTSDEDIVLGAQVYCDAIARIMAA